MTGDAAKSSAVIVFDLDDTLYLERDFVVSGFRAVSKWLTENLGITNFLNIAVDLFDAGARGNVFDRTLGALGYPVDATLIQRLLDVYRNHRPSLSLCADAAKVLPKLRERHRIALLSDGYAKVQRGKVAALELEHQFDLLVYSDELGGRDAWKPSAAPYERVMADLECAGSTCMYVADNPKKDFVTARRLGWKTVRVRREGGQHQRVDVEPHLEAACTMASLWQLPDHVLASFPEDP